MEGSSNNSFIPKRGPANRPKRVASQQVYIFTLICYVVFFATLVATAGLFLYSRYIDSQFQSEVGAFAVEIQRFKDSDLNRVLDFDRRLSQVSSRVEHSVSLSSVFTALEKATIKTVQIKELKLERNQDADFELLATIKTDDFDSSIFQREMFEQDNVVSSVDIAEIKVGSTADDEDVKNNVPSDLSEVTFVAKLGVPVASVPFIPKFEPTVAEPIAELDSQEVPAEENDNLEARNEINL